MPPVAGFLEMFAGVPYNREKTESLNCTPPRIYLIRIKMKRNIAYAKGGPRFPIAKWSNNTNIRIKMKRNIAYNFMSPGYGKGLYTD